MAVDWYLMDQPPIYNGGFEGEEFFAYAQDGFKEMLFLLLLPARQLYRVLRQTHN